MILKSYIIEQNINSLAQYKMILFYGENQGIKKEFKDNLKTIHKNKEVLNLFQEEIIKAKDFLINEISSQSLFGEKKLIFINEVNDKILNILEELNEYIQEDRIFLFGDVLDKKSKLRSYFEKSKEHASVACYQDNEIGLKKIISNKLAGYSGINNQTINLIIQSSGLDRGKIYNEIEKIKHCFKEKKIEIEKLENLLNLKTNDDFSQLKDEAIKGNKFNTNKLLSETIFQTENSVYYLNSINQRINKLNDIENLKHKEKNLDTIINQLKPPVFWKDKPILIEQSKKWNKKRLQEILKKTYNAEIELKSNSMIRKDLLLKMLILDLCSTANFS
jgi:DNA polymerase III subunit delta